MNNSERDQAKGGVGILSLLAATNVPNYSTMKEVKSEATGCQQTDLYTLRNNRVTVLRMSLVHVDVTEDNREISSA